MKSKILTLLFQSLKSFDTNILNKYQNILKKYQNILNKYQKRSNVEAVAD